MKHAMLALAVLMFAGCEINVDSEGIVSRETKRFTVTGVPQVELDTFDGAIEVHSWDRNEVEVEIEKRAMEQQLVDEMQVTAEQQGDRIVVKVTAPSRSEGFDGIQIGVHISPTARLRVALPRNTQLTASSDDGSITVEDVTGTIRLTALDGSIRGSRLNGDVYVRSSDGAIRLDRSEGAFDVETEDGSITMAAKLTKLRARTSDGSIRLDVEPDSSMADDWDLQTSDGSVVLQLPTGFDAMIDAETGDGRVSVNHPGLADEARRGDDREERRRTLRATLGAGGKILRVRSGDGSIRIE